ncbi:MAG: hypothetical protein ABSH41_26390 [Syntrophobacteraceae bacterium]|jgi:hypothetical protein
MNARKIIVLAALGLALFMIVPTTGAKAEDCYYCNPFLFPFAVGAAIVGTAAAIVTAPFCPYCGPYGPYPYYYGPGPGPAYYGSPPAPAYYSPGPGPGPAPYHSRVWVRGHYDRNGAWVPGHWRVRKD